MKAFLQEKALRLLRCPPSSAMTIDNLYAYLDALYQRRLLEGPVVELGCARGGTTVQACRFLSRIGCRKDYWCFDTFGGFVEEQLATDHQLGLASRHDRLFADNSRTRFLRTLSSLGIRDHVHVVQADVCSLDPSAVPNDISVALVDVDLREPVYSSLKLIYPKLASGGIVMVDDCKGGTSWVGADVGYRDFMSEHELEPRYFLGFGIVEHAGGHGGIGVPWTFSRMPNLVGEDFFS